MTTPKGWSNPVFFPSTLSQIIHLFVHTSRWLETAMLCPVDVRPGIQVDCSLQPGAHSRCAFATRSCKPTDKFSQYEVRDLVGLRNEYVPLTSIVGRCTPEIRKMRLANLTRQIWDIDKMSIGKEIEKCVFTLPRLWTGMWSKVTLICDRLTFILREETRPIVPSSICTNSTDTRGTKWCVVGELSEPQTVFHLNNNLLFDRVQSELFHPAAASKHSWPSKDCRHRFINTFGPHLPSWRPLQVH